MASDDKIEETIKAIAARHGIAVSRDDPILVLQTINDRLMQDSQAAQQEILEGFKSELEAIAHRWGEDSKGKAERTLNAALAASKEAMAQGMKDGAKAAAEAVQREFDASAAKLASTKSICAVAACLPMRIQPAWSRAAPARQSTERRGKSNFAESKKSNHEKLAMSSIALEREL
mgnify:CR=1 FL=1